MIFPYWDDQRTDVNTGCSSFPGGTCGIFTSTTGTAPNRIFNIEWRTVYFRDSTQPVNYELRLYEVQTHFDVIYGTVPFGNTDATAGVQRDIPPLTNTSASVRVVKLLAGKATCWRPAELRRLRQRHHPRLPSARQ